MEDDTLRLSQREREAAVSRLQTAFLDGRINDAELGERIDHALNARIRGDLVPVLADLPVPVSSPLPTPDAGAPTPLRWVATHKASAVQAGRWTVPARFKSVAYKGTQVLNLTRAILTAPRTEIRITAYKSTVEIIVPAGLRVEMRGLSYRGTWTDETQGGAEEGPVLVVRGFAYKGDVVVKKDS